MLMPFLRLRYAALCITILASACGGGSSASSSGPTPSAAATPTPAPNVLLVAGTYPTRTTVIAEKNTCGNVTAQDNPTVVIHNAGATTIALEHAGSTYRGTIDTAGRFSTPGTDFAFPDANYTIAISGRFTMTGFEGTVELTKRTGSSTCTYAVGWVGTKQGSPNVIPG